MNQAYRIIWNYALQTWVAAPETARSRGKGAKKIIVGAVMALFGVVGNSAFAATPDSYAVGLLGGGVNPAECLTSAVPGLQTSSTYCDGGSAAFGAGFAAYNDTGALGAYAMALDADTLQFGAGGKAILSITGTGINAYSSLNMNGNKITGLPLGTVSSVSKDAITGAQLYATGNTTAAALGGGSAVNALGIISAPSYDLSGGTFGNVNDALVSLDKEGVQNKNDIADLNTTMTFINNGGGIKYFHTNSKLADSSATGDDAVAIGGNAVASAPDSIAIGSNSVASREMTLSVGAAGAERQITDVADGVQDTDAVNYRQLQSEIKSTVGNAVQYDTTDKQSVKLGGADATAPVAMTNLADGKVEEGSNDAVNGSQLHAVASSTAAALGGNASVADDGTITAPQYKLGGKTFNNVGDALTNVDGRVANNTGEIVTINNTLNSINNGGGIKYFHANSKLADSSATGVDAVAIGGNAIASAKSAVALGSNSVANRDNTVSVGAAGAERQVTNVADGTQATDAVNLRQLTNTTANAVLYDTAAHDKVTFGNATSGPAVKLGNVAAGTLSATSKEAVNGSQLFAFANSTSNALGGGSSVNTTTGAVNAPTYTFADTSTFNNVGDALTNLDTRVTNNTNDIVSINNTLNSINDGGGIKYFHANSSLVDSSATGAESVAIGGNAQAKHDNSIAIGSNSVTDRENSVSIGDKGAERQITNVAAGKEDTDAVNVAQLNTSIQTGLANAVTYDDDSKTSVTFGGKGAAPVTLNNVKAGSVAPDSLEAVNGSQLYGMGANVASALGGNAKMNADGTFTGPSYDLSTKSFNNVGDALTDLDGRVALNTVDITSINTILNNMTSGGGMMYFHANSTLADSSATGAESVAIGGNAQAMHDNSVAIGSNSVTDRDNSVSVGAVGAERQITNVAPGTKDTDAVNVAQLREAGLVDGNGVSSTALTYDHSEDGSTDYNNVTLGNGSGTGTAIHNVAAGTDTADAVNVGQMQAAIDRVTNIAQSGGNPMFAADGNRDTEIAQATGAHSVAIGANANASADNSVALGANSVADRVNTVSVGSMGSERQITNVASGTADTDAVNVRQLNLASAQAQSYTDARISGVQGQINDVAGKAWGGIASAMAVAGLPQPTGPGKTMVAIAGSRFSGATGAAIGVSYTTPNDRWVVKFSGNTSSYGSVGVVLGSGYQW
jgi:trimeric autotransporter adhesin